MHGVGGTVARTSCHRELRTNVSMTTIAARCRCLGCNNALNEWFTLKWDKDLLQRQRIDLYSVDCCEEIVSSEFHYFLLMYNYEFILKIPATKCLKARQWPSTMECFTANLVMERTSEWKATVTEWGQECSAQTPEQQYPAGQSHKRLWLYRLNAV